MLRAMYKWFFSTRSAGIISLDHEHDCREKDNPKNWHVAKNITIIPPAKQMGGTPLDNIRAFFSGVGK